MTADARRITPITAARSAAAIRSRAARTAGDRNAVLLLLPVAMLLVVGLGALLSSSSVVAIREGVEQWFYVKRQLFWIVLGIGALIATIRIPYRWYERAAAILLALGIAGLVATLVIGQVRGGSRRWIEVGPITVQASEFVKFAQVAFIASVFARKREYLDRFSHVLWPVVASLGLIGVLLILEPDLGTALLIAATTLAVLTASAAPLRHVFGLGILGASAATALAYASPYRRNRIAAFLDPTADPLDTTLQPLQSLVALGTGGWFGVGLGASRARWSFLPNAHTDFIFAIIGEEVGFAGSIVVVALFVFFAIMGMVIAYRAPDRFGRLLAVGIVAWLTLQALINIGGVAVVLPITGVPLPFVSAGGSAMIMNLAAVGVLVNIARAPRRAEA
ncbi:MAG: putative lipid II flippase FtsW [Acidimicrobiia bacterium]